MRYTANNRHMVTENNDGSRWCEDCERDVTTDERHDRPLGICEFCFDPVEHAAPHVMHRWTGAVLHPGCYARRGHSMLHWHSAEEFRAFVRDWAPSTNPTP